jgi:hypothetical protein
MWPCSGWTDDPFQREDDAVPTDVAAVDADHLAQWCAEHLGSPPAEELFRSGHLSAVIGLRLGDGRRVVVKIRPSSPRITACVAVQRHMFAVGYPCPRPLTDPAPFGDDLATAEAYVPGGATFPTSDPVVAAADAFAWLIRLAPPAAEVGPLEPPPSWAHWDQAGDTLWPSPEDEDVDLNVVRSEGWIDEAGRRARDRLRVGGSEPVIGHCDWLADNLDWSRDRLLVVHDWDSMISESEDILVGLAAALYSARTDELASVEETEKFLTAYCRARGRHFSPDERERAWAAGVWTRANDAKFQDAMGLPVTSLSESQAAERLRRAGTSGLPGHL